MPGGGKGEGISGRGNSMSRDVEGKTPSSWGTVWLESLGPGAEDQAGKRALMKSLSASLGRRWESGLSPVGGRETEGCFQQVSKWPELFWEGHPRRAS